MLGGVTSLTVTVKLQLAVLAGEAASLAVQLTVVVPSGKALPEGGAQLMLAPGQLSVAVAGVMTTVAWHLPGSVL